MAVPGLKNRQLMPSITARDIFPESRAAGVPCPWGTPTKGSLPLLPVPSVREEGLGGEHSLQGTGKGHQDLLRTGSFRAWG